jgi:hypothetical protein
MHKTFLSLRKFLPLLMTKERERFPELLIVDWRLEIGDLRGNLKVPSLMPKQPLTFQSSINNQPGIGGEESQRSFWLRLRRAEDRRALPPEF